LVLGLETEAGVVLLIPERKVENGTPVSWYFLRPSKD
jgi:hypothetical protein